MKEAKGLSELDTKYIASFSGGKDSMATVILAHENKEPLDLILFAGFRFRVASDWHYCSKCGTMLDLAEWQQEETPAPAAVVGEDEELKFDE